MRAQLDAGNFRIYDFYPLVRVRFLEPPELPENWERSLFNINTPEDLDTLKRTAGSRRKENKC